jgi:hypothetical protein
MTEQRQTAPLTAVNPRLDFFAADALRPACWLPALLTCAQVARIAQTAGQNPKACAWARALGHRSKMQAIVFIDFFDLVKK